MVYSQWWSGLEVKTQSDLCFEKTPFGLYVNQLEKARVGRGDPVLLHQSEQEKMVAWPGRGEGVGKSGQWIHLRGYLESKIRKA